MNRDLKNKSIKSETVRKMAQDYLVKVLIFVGAILGLFVFAWLFLSQFVWQKGDTIYRVAQFIRRSAKFWLPLLIMVGVVYISCRMLRKLMECMDEIVEKAGELAHPSEQPIRMSEGLKDIENRLNLAREQALRSLVAAKEAEQRKNDLIVYLAHDLKTPLTSVIGYLQLLEDEPGISMETRCRYTGIALEKAVRLEDLINEFFDITRFNLTTIVLEPETVDLSLMLQQICSEFTPILEEKGLYWNLDLQENVHVYADPDKLERVMDNLIRNAVSYSYSGSGLELSLSAGSEKVCISLKNKGKPIPPEKLSHIFEQFYRVDSSRTSATGGAGLGLAIAREIVEKHGGSVYAESSGESILFTVILPGMK